MSPTPENEATVPVSKITGILLVYDSVSVPTVGQPPPHHPNCLPLKVPPEGGEVLGFLCNLWLVAEKRYLLSGEKIDGATTARVRNWCGRFTQAAMGTVPAFEILQRLANQNLVPCSVNPWEDEVLVPLSKLLAEMCEFGFLLSALG
jgi:hypothetical protein